MRISGLVRFYNQVRERLKGGIPEEDLVEFREGVQQVLFRVEELCESHPAGPEGLPGPSRKAYRFLRELDLDNLPPPRPGVPVARPPVKIAGLVAIESRLAERMWWELDELLAFDSAYRTLEADIGAHTSAVEDICSENDTDPSALAARSLRVYAWLKFLGSEGTLPKHLGALGRAREAALRAGGGISVPDRVLLTNISGLYRTKPARGVRILVCSEGFLQAPSEIWDAIFSVASGEKAPGARQLARQFATTDSFSRVVLEMESLARPPSSARGVHHDLDAAFERVDERYFEGHMPRPNLEWSTVPTSRKMGHYHHAGDTVLVSVTLDDPKVPEFVVDFIVYHELLHKLQGIRWINGRFAAHDADFRTREKRFARYAEAKAFLNAFSRR